MYLDPTQTISSDLSLFMLMDGWMDGGTYVGD